MHGANVFGEVSRLETAKQINYLAFATFSSEPATTWEAFVDRVLGPLLGSPEAAAEYLSILELLPRPETAEAPSGEAALHGGGAGPRTHRGSAPATSSTADGCGS